MVNADRTCSNWTNALESAISKRCSFPPFDGENVQDAIFFPVIGWLCVSVSLFAAIGSETEIQFACRLEIASALYLHCSRGKKLARHEKWLYKHTAHSRSWRDEPQRKRTSLEAGISVGILPGASRSCSEVYKPCICLETVTVCSTTASKRFR